MGKILWLTIGALALVTLTGVAFAQGCGGGGTTAHSCGGGGTTGHDHGTAASTATPQGDLPPAENMISLTGTVVSIAPNGAALVDTGTAKLYVLANAKPAQDGSVPPSAFKVGDKVQVAGVLLALQIQPATAEAGASEAQLKQVRLKVESILCGACSTAVQKALQATRGVKLASVGNEGIALVQFDPAATSAEALAKVIAGARHPHGGMKFKATLLP